MSELRVQEIHNPNDQTGGITIDNNDNVSINGQALPSAGPLSNRNLIINGAMNVAQRGTTSTQDGYRTVDRFALSRAQGATQQDQISINNGNGQLAPIWDAGFRNFYRITNTTGSSAANSLRAIVYFVEAQDLATSGWVHDDPNSFITLSFWVRASVNQRYWASIETEAGTEQAFVFPIQDVGNNTLSANTWTRIVRTIPGNANVQINDDNTRGIRIAFAPWWGTDFTGTGATEQWRDFDTADRAPAMDDNWAIDDGATFDITGVQLEVGEVATPFEHRPIGTELALCQRYFHEIGAQFATPGFVSSGSNIVFGYDYPAPMRANPQLANQSSDIRINNGGQDTQANAAPAVNRVTTEHITITAGAAGNTTSGRVEPKEPGTVFIQSGSLWLNAEL